MFGSDSFPLGPNNRFPKQRISSYGVVMIPPVSMQDTYLSGHNTVARLPNTEKDFHSSVNKAKRRMKNGMAIRRGGIPTVELFRPRYAPQSRLGEEDREIEYRSMDQDPMFDSEGHRFDEGETDDSVGRVVGGRIVSERMIGSKAIRGATFERPISQSVVGSGGWLKGIQKLLGFPS